MKLTWLTIPFVLFGAPLHAQAEVIGGRGLRELVAFLWSSETASPEGKALL
jgi:hypothetical protein